MKTTILMKMLVVMLIVSVIPLGTLGYLALQDARDIGFTAANDAQELGEQNLQDTRSMGRMAVDDATAAMTGLASKVIRIRAKSTAKQIEIYIKDHPGMTVEDLQNDPYFKSLAVQPVGDTGYTAVHEASSLINRFHASEKTVNLDLNKLRDKLPDFFAIIEKNTLNQDSSGYYDWEDPNGKMREKYMYCALVNATTADGIQFSVAATTYIDEFTSPITETEQKIQNSVNQTAARILAANQETRETIAQRTEGMGTQNTIFIITGLTILVVVLVSFLFARALTRPIKKLKEVAQRVSNGDFNVRMPDVRSRDEILDLTAAMELLVTGFKHLKTQVAQLTAKPAGSQQGASGGAPRPSGQTAPGQQNQGGQK